MLKPRQGFSLIEILVAMAAGAVVMAAALSLFISLLSTTNTNLKLSRLNQEVQTISDMLSRDIQRAGYHPSAISAIALDQPAAAQQFTFSSTDDLYPTSDAAHCIRLHFWEPSAASGKQSVSRVYSYQASNGKLKLLIDNNASRTELLSKLCGIGNRLVSSDEIDITELTFVLIASSEQPHTRSLEMTLSAAYVDHSELSQTLYRRILLRNQGEL